MAALAESVVEQRDVMEKDKFGVRVTPLHVFEGGLIVRRGAAVQRTLVVENASDEMRELAGASFLQRGPGPFSSSFTGEDGALVLTPGGKVTLTLTCRPILSGMCNNVLNLNFGHFGIARFLEVRCGDADAITDLAPTRPYQRRPRRRPPPPTDETEVVEAPPLGSSSFGGAAANTRRAQAGKLPLYRIPGSLRAAVGSGEAGEALEAACEQMKRLLGGVSEAAALAAYKKAFHELLWVEEMQLNDDLREFDLRADDATVLTPRGRLFALEVRGLAENRPSVLKGDVIKANFPGDPGRVFEGRAREIERETVLLEFNNTRFQYVAGQRIEISFVLSRTPPRRFHQGLDGVDRAGTAGAASRLFPEMAHLATAQLHAARSVAAPLRPFDRRINAQQLAAVTAIVEGRARHVPYIIYGPPGTGKTTTVVECVLQCVKRVTGAELRVLVSSPTNTAADVLCKRLSEGGLGSKMDMLRVNAYTRNPNDIDERVLRHSNCAPAERTIEMPPKEELERVRVVVATLTTAAKLCGEGIPRGHFDVIVIDEAGQAQEPEALAAASMLLGQGGQLVLAGDPKQLGPVIHHSLAKEHGLSTSVLERLMERPIYQKHPLPGGFEEYDPRVLTKLLQNFRAHETLLELPNQLFYEGELLCRGDELLLKCCEGWEGLPSQGVPLLFDGIVGKDQQEERSPSWFNVDECHRVLEHVRDLLRAHNGCSVRLTPEDIGVIAPYNKQVQKLKRLFRAEQLEGIKVGSTEMFQGQEKRVIIISTVRSSPDWVGCDVRHNLGFLHNPKRFNVAITRAQALLIVVGNPNVLRLDFHWGRSSSIASTTARTGACRCSRCPAPSPTRSPPASRATWNS